MLLRVVYRGIEAREGHKQGYREEHTRGLLVQRYKGAEVTLVTGTERYKKGGHHISGWCC